MNIPVAKVTHCIARFHDRKKNIPHFLHLPIPHQTIQHTFTLMNKTFYPVNKQYKTTYTRDEARELWREIKGKDGDAMSFYETSLTEINSIVDRYLISV